jgi:hypothetical protein
MNGVLTPEQKETYIDFWVLEDALEAMPQEIRIDLARELRREQQEYREPREPRRQLRRVEVEVEEDIPALARRHPEGWERFLEHKRHFRIPQHATYGGIHRRLCGHARCDRRGGEMGVRFVNRRYRCEEHEDVME